MYEAGHAFYEQLQKSKNVLLVKDDVGKPKVPTRRLPPTGHAYGFKPKGDIEGAGAILTSWSEHNRSNEARPDVDYRKLNKACAGSKCPRPKELGKFSVRTSAGKVGARPDYEKMLFGVKNRPSTPIDIVMSNEYGNRAIVEKHQVYSGIRSNVTVEKEPAKLATHKELDKQPQNKEAFKLKKFAKVHSKVNSNNKK